MLTQKDRDYIKLHGFSSFHDYTWMSLYAGEPFLENDILAYYDGRLVRIYGFPFRKDAQNNIRKTKNLVKLWVFERKAEAIMYLGPIPLDLSFLGKYKFWRVALKPRSRYSSELLIDCTGNPGTVLTKWLYRHSYSKDFDLKIKTGDIVSAQQLRLFEYFYKSVGVSGYLADVAFALPAIMQLSSFYIIEAWKQGNICGLSTFHKPFIDVAIGHLLVHDDQTPGVCDFLYAHVLNLAKKLGANYMNVGASKSPGQYDFKRKWGARPGVPPYYMVIWTLDSLTDFCYPTWGPRLLNL